MTYALLPFTFQIVLQSIALFPISLIFGKPVGFREGILLVQWWKWWDGIWDFTTCIAYVLGASRYHQSEATWFHEVGVHVKQYEDLAVLSDIVALGVYLSTGNWIVALVIWGTGGPLWMAPNYLTALRFRKAGKALGYKLWRTMYMFSEHERSAYAQEAAWKRNGGR